MRPLLSIGFTLLFASGMRVSLAQDSHTTNTDRPFIYPDHVTAQFAGNIGLLSAGIGYSYAKDKLQTDFLYGFAPAFESRTTIHILTAKTAYYARPKDISEKYSWVPVRAGTGISYSIGRQFFTQLPKHYPSGYYWFSTSFRLTPFVGSALQLKLNEGRTSVKKLELYGDLGTTDIHLLSYGLNTKALKPWQIFNIAFGLKAVF